LPANPNPLDYFVEFISNELWNLIVEETNRYAHQKLCDLPERLAKFVRRHIYGLGYEVVTKLVRPFMNRNHHVFFDNFFTTTKLLEHLEVNSTYACGKVRCSRKDLPACAKDKLKAGEKLVRQKDHVVFTKWHHKQEVSIMSTIVSPLADDVEVNQVVKPVVIDLYNKSMGGVAHANQLRECYSVGRSCSKRYRHIFWFLIDISICNAFVLCNYHRLGLGQCKLKQLDFRLSLAKQLIGGFSTTMSAAQSSKRRKIEAFALEQGNSSKHFIDKIKGRKRQCVQCKREGAKTPKGRPIETSFECVQCSVALCKEVCFYDYHML